MNELVNILVEKMPNETFYYQTGHTDFLHEYKNLTTIGFTSHEQFKTLVEESELIITHGGINSVVDALLMNKLVIIFPRRVEYNEHNDNHQLQITDVFAKKEYAYALSDYQKITEVVKKMLNHEISFKHLETSNTKMVHIIKSYIGEDTNE